MDVLASASAAFIGIWALCIAFASTAGSIVYLPLAVAIYLGIARLILGGTPQEA